MDATADEIGNAARAAQAAAHQFARTSAQERAAFLRRIADELLALGDSLLNRTASETGLPRPRLESERARTMNQLKMFAELVEEGSWVDARIDHALPERRPTPRPDIRRMLHAVGPVAVFGASNFPLAFSVPGGDTASALAAGCTVVVKAHPAHPGTAELAARAIIAAAAATGMPDGVFSLLNGVSPAAALSLVGHDAIEAAAFTGSFRAGRALHDVAALRSRPIAVFAEMGSANPVFILPGAVAERGAEIVRGLFESVTLGVGQFCTSPGLTFVIGDRLPGLDSLFSDAAAGAMTHSAVKTSYDANVSAALRAGASLLAQARSNQASHLDAEGRPALLATNLANWSANPRLGDEIYGPATLLVCCASAAELLAAARSLHGHLTATVHATAADLAEHATLLDVLRSKAGRLVLNGFPTGVEVCAAIHHGGPYPAAIDPRFTSVGTAAILRFARPVCYQGFPDSTLPAELQESNPRGILRWVDGQATRS
jgi:NADP-dependent aldehyde dehydrogenase